MNGVVQINTLPNFGTSIGNKESESSLMCSAFFTCSNKEKYKLNIISEAIENACLLLKRP